MQGRSVGVVARWALGALVLAFAVTYLWLVTYGTWSLARNEPRGEAFDSLGQHLLSLDAGVDQPTIDWEGLTTGSRTVMYFGPFPALLRIVPGLVFPGMFGLWSRPSCLLAALLALAAVIATSLAALTTGGRALDRQGRLYMIAATLGFGLGTPVVYLVSCGRIYHEPILWGLCGSLWSIFFIVRLLNRQIAAPRGLFGLASSFAVTLLSRLTFALPTALALVAFAVDAIARELKAPRPRASRAKAVLLLALALSPAAAAGTFQLWYNYNRFGSPWDINRINSYVQPEEIGGIFNIRRLPSALRNYFGLEGDSLVAQPPFFRLARVHYADDTLFFGWKEETLSLALGSSWLLLGGILGAFALLRRPRSGLKIAVALLFLAQALVISTYYFVTERFAAEYLPFLIFLFAAYLGATSPEQPSRRVFLPVLLGLALVSSVVTVGSTLQWNQAVNGDVPSDYKLRLAQLLYREASMPGDHRELVQLGDLEPLAQQGSDAPVQKNTTWDRLPLVFGSIYYRKGLGMHATSSATYAVPAGANAFRALVGFPDSTIRCPNGSVVFELRDQNDRLLYRSAMIRTGYDPEQVQVDLRGVDRLTLVVDDAGDGTECDDAAWGMPAFVLGTTGSTPG